MGKRERWMLLHRYLGLLAALWLTLLGLSGSLLVYYPELDAALNPGLLTHETRGQPLSASVLVETIEQAYPAWRVGQLRFPSEEDRNVSARIARPDAPAQWREVLIDPVSARLHGDRPWARQEVSRRTAFSWLYAFHSALMLKGELGEYLVGGLGLIMLTSVISGLCLWWPRGGKWKQALGFKPRASTVRRHVDLHRIGGYVGALVLGGLALTGMQMNLPRLLTTPLQWVSPVTRHQAPPTVVPGTAPLALERLLVQAQARHPHARVTRVVLATQAGRAWRIDLRQPGAVGTTGSTWVYLDPYRGDVLRVVDSQAQSAGDAMLEWVFPLHNGTAFGATGRVLICLAGWLPLLLSVTGIYVWWRKRPLPRLAVAAPLEKGDCP